MKRVLVILSLMLVSASFVFAGSAGETVVTGGTGAIMAEPTGLYPEYWQFTDLDEMEDVTGIRLTEFGEAPELTVRVTAGELPPVEQRIPSQPLVIVRNEIGTYGGTIRTAHEGTLTALY
jgi:hypothetical protein